MGEIDDVEKWAEQLGSPRAEKKNRRGHRGAFGLIREDGNRSVFARARNSAAHRLRTHPVKLAPIRGGDA
jgi:hypothetical protein